MKIIKTIKNQTIWDLAVQEYGTVEAGWQILQDNNLTGLNDFPQGYENTAGGDFDVAYPIKPAIPINIHEHITIDNKTIANQLNDIKS